MKTNNCENILGYQISTMDIGKSIEKIASWINDNAQKKVFVCANPHSLVLAKDDVQFQQAIHSADLVTADGAGIILASKILGEEIRERVTGSDIFRGLSDELNRTGGRSYFFLGSSEKTLAAIQEKMAEDYPEIIFAGSYSPPYKPEFSKEDSQKIRVNQSCSATTLESISYTSIP